MQKLLLLSKEEKVKEFINYDQVVAAFYIKGVKRPNKVDVAEFLNRNKQKYASMDLRLPSKSKRTIENSYDFTDGDLIEIREDSNPDYYKEVYLDKLDFGAKLQLLQDVEDFVKLEELV